MKLEHIGIAIKKLEESEKIFEDLLNAAVYKREVIHSQSVETAFIQTDNAKIELLRSTNPEGPIARFIEKRGEGIHHIAFEVENIDDEIQRLKKVGYTLINEEPQIGADNKRIVFLHPRSTNGVLIELCQEIQPDDHI